MTTVRDPLFALVKKITEPEAPAQLHQNIMLTVFLSRFRFWLSALSVVFSVNLVVSGISLWSKLAERSAFSIIRELSSGFEFSSYFFWNLWNSLQDFWPLNRTFVFASNLLLVAFLYYFLWRSKMESGVD